MQAARCAMTAGQRAGMSIDVGLLFRRTLPVHRPSLDRWIARRIGVPAMNANVLSGSPSSCKTAHAVIVGTPGRVTEDLVGGQDLL